LPELVEGTAQTVLKRKGFMSRFTKLTVAATMTIGVMGMAQTVFAQAADIAYIPFIVNVDAAVKAEREGAESVSINVSADTEDTLKIPLGSTSNVRHRPQNAPGNAPIITYNQRGMVSVNLPAQTYQNAEVSLYTINGRRILRTNADANVSQTAKSISRPNLVAGVYLISIMGTNGQKVSNRLTHRGGNLNINIVFRGNDYSPAVLPTTTTLSRQAAANAFEDWTITVSAEKFIDSTYQFNVVENVNPTQDIILRPNGSHFNPNIRYGSFSDPRDDQVYRTVIIGELIWMAENYPFSYIVDISG
jgi:hypothetical protein